MDKEFNSLLSALLLSTYNMFIRSVVVVAVATPVRGHKAVNRQIGSLAIWQFLHFGYLIFEFLRQARWLWDR